MLALTRKKGERVMIGKDVVLTVIDIERGKVRLGFTAPRDLEIDREEVRDAKDNRPRPTAE